MKTGFRISLLLLAFVFVIGCAAMACADVIYTPMDDFFGTHHEECQYNDRYYITAGPNGTVTVYESPESDTVVLTLENGLDLYISWVYDDPEGIQWGCWENFETGDSGWIPMEYLELIYDGQSFLEEYSDEIRYENGTLGEEYAGMTICFWEYPGSQVHYDTYFEDAYAPDYNAVYTDDAGRTWGMVGYYMSFSGWICLDDPTADYDTLFPEVEPPTEPTIEETQATEIPTEPVAEIVPKKTVNVPLLVGAVSLVVAATGGMLFALKRKK